MCHVPLDLTRPGALLKKQSPTKAFTMCLQHSSDPRALSVCQYTEPTDTAAMPASAQHRWTAVPCLQCCSTKSPGLAGAAAPALLLGLTQRPPAPVLHVQPAFTRS